MSGGPASRMLLAAGHRHAPTALRLAHTERPARHPPNDLSTAPVLDRTVRLHLPLLRAPFLAILESTDFRRRSGLLILVFGASLALVAATAFALVTVVSDGLTRAAIDSSVRSDRSLVQGFVASNLVSTDVRVSGVDPARVSAIELQIAAFIRRSSVGGQSPGIVHIKIWTPDGTVLYSERSDLRGTPSPRK
jgi:hypothetical protein